MKIMLDSFNKAFRVMKSDSVIIMLSFIPIMIGIIIYYFAGRWMYVDVLLKGKDWIQSSLAEGAWGSVLYYLIFILLSVALYLFVSWTFVLVVSFISAPFNDLISGRVEKKIIGDLSTEHEVALKYKILRVFKIIKNEFIKVLLIAFISIIAFCFSFIPLLVPFSIGMTAVLLASSFLDYSWSRHNLTFAQCLNDLRSSLLMYGFSGFIFMTLVTVPLLNLLVLPYAVVYYTILYVTKNQPQLS